MFNIIKEHATNFSTPPPTPLVGSQHEDLIFNDELNNNDLSIDNEVFTLNFTFQDFVNEFTGEVNGSQPSPVREDLMWHREIENDRADTSTPCLTKKLSERSLVTPLIFDKSISDQIMMGNIEQPFEKRIENLPLNIWNASECLPTPVEPESDTEVDVVGIDTENNTTNGTLLCNERITSSPPELIQQFKNNTKQFFPRNVEKLFKDDYRKRTNQTTIKLNSMYNMSNVAAQCEEINNNKAGKHTNEKVLPLQRTIRKSLRRSTSQSHSFQYDSFSSDELEESPSKPSKKEPHNNNQKESHNNTEKKRRIQLKQQFEELKMLIPDIAPNPRVPKVIILKKATEYIDILKADEDELSRFKCQLKAVNVSLTQEVNAVLQEPKFCVSYH